MSNHHIDILTSGSESKKSVDWPRILLILVSFESLRRDIKAYVKGLFHLPLVESPGRSHVATSSCYQRRLVDRRMYPSVWSRNCLFPPIGKAEAMIHISSLSRRLIKIVLYKPVKITIDAPDFAEVILDVVVCHPTFQIRPLP